MNVRDLKNLLNNYLDDLEIVTCYNHDSQYMCFDADNIDIVNVFVDEQDNIIEWYFNRPKNARQKTLLVIK